MAFNETLQNELRSIIAAGLKKRSLTSCAKWAKASVVMSNPFPGPFSFEHHPWLKEVHDPNAPEVIAKKSAQVGFTVAAMNRTFYMIDVKRQSVLYLLPTKTPDATDFSATRFDPALELSPYLANLFSDVKNVGAKRAGSAVLFIRGANSKPGLRSIPVSNIVFDEFDMMPPENIPLALERTSGQVETELWYISTPTAPNYGIDAEYSRSTQETFDFPCPACSRLITLSPDDLIVRADSDHDEAGLLASSIACPACKHDLVTGKECYKPFLSKGVWVTHNESHRRGFYLNQLYSMAKAGQPYELARSKILASGDKFREGEYQNSKMGLAHLAEGAKLSDGQVYQCKTGPAKTSHPPSGLITMGVDVGKWLHCVVECWHSVAFDNDINVRSRPTVVTEVKVKTFEELDQLMRDYQVNHCCIDANPETRKATEFAKRFYGYVTLIYYARGRVGSKDLDIVADACTYKRACDRTYWLDQTLGRFHTGRIILPTDVSEEYVKHLCEPARIMKLDGDGNPVATYINKGADHFAHATNYAEIALPLAAAQVSGRDIRGFL